MKERFAAVFKTKTRDEWSAIFDGTDACVAPVLSPWEAHRAPAQRCPLRTYVEVDGAVQPAPAPRFSRTPSAVSKPPSPPGADTVSGLVEWGVDEDVVAKLRSRARSADAGWSVARTQARCGRAGRAPAGPGPRRNARCRGVGWARSSDHAWFTSTTGQVMVRVMPSICWMSRTTMRPRSFMDGASARAITS